MSTTAILQQLVGRLLTEKRLFELPSEFTGSETARTMIVSTEILHAVTGPFAVDDPNRERLAEFRRWLDNFSELGHFTVAENPRAKPAESMMARVAPVEEQFFSMRVLDPEDTPGIRCLGGFADKDKFIALTWELREHIEIFDDEVDIVRSAWVDLFGNVPPHSGEHLDDYLSNCTAV